MCFGLHCFHATVPRAFRLDLFHVPQLDGILAVRAVEVTGLALVGADYHGPLGQRVPLALEVVFRTSQTGPA